MSARSVPIARRHGVWPLAGLAATMLLPSLGTSIANAGLPSFAGAFGAGFQDVQWVVLAYLLAITTLVVSAGRLGDLVGRRRLLLGGVAVFALASGVAGFAGDLWVLVAARAAQGAGAAAMMALGTAMAGDVVPRERLGGAMGLMGAMSAVGTALGPSLGGILMATFGWPSIFVFLAALAGATFALLHAAVPSTPRRETGVRPSFDVTGTLVLALTLAAYALAMTTGRGGVGLANLLLLAAAAIGSVLFVAVEARAASPLVRLRALADARLRAGLVSAGLVATVMMATLVVGPFFLAVGLGLTPLGIGLAMSVGPAMAAVAGVPAGRAVDRVGTGRVMLAGLAAMIAGCLSLALFAAAIAVWGYVAAVGTTALGYALFQAANNTAIMSGATAADRGAIAGLLSLARNLGLITGASAMGAVFAFGSRGVAAGAVADGTALAFAVAAGLTTVTMILAVRASRSGRLMGRSGRRGS